MKQLSSLKRLWRSDRPQSAEPRAFTLVELLVVMAVLAVLATLLLPALAKAKSRDLSEVCMSNCKQLITATLTYSDDFTGYMPPNEPAGIGNQTDWCTLGMDWTATHPDNTNYQKLTQPQYCLITSYVGSNYTIFHCPGDKSFVVGEGFRVRSVSMNSGVGTVWAAVGCLKPNDPVNGYWFTGGAIGSGCQTVWRTYGKTTDFTLPGPSITWVFAEEHCDSINDSVLAVQCANQGLGAAFIDRPANYHDGACPFSFADGHAEMHRWSGPSLAQAPVYWNGDGGENYSLDVVNAADNQDLIWLQQHTSSRK